MTPGPSPLRPPPSLLLRRLVENVTALVRNAILLALAPADGRRWLVVRLDRGLSEIPGPPAWLSDWMQGPRPLATTLRALRYAATDPRLRGVLLRVGGRGIGWSKTTVLARALRAVHDAGKLVVVYADRTGNAGAWLGAQADRFWMAPEGRLDLIGVRTESPFVRRALERLGIRPQVLQVGRYKSVAEILTRDSMSAEGREALEGVVEGLYGALVEGLATRAGSPGRARQWIDGGPYVASEAREAGIVDDLVYGDELAGRLERLASGDGAGQNTEARLISEGSYLRRRRTRFGWRPLLASPDRVAIVPIVGLLGAGAGSPSGVLGVLRALEKDDGVAAVVVRIDTPGGDPLASDLLWRAIRRISERKPVVASLGDTAASGGYYAAMGAAAIVAEPTTLTGSIGVVWAMLDLGDLLARIGVSLEAVERGAHAGIYDPTRARTEGEMARLREQVERIYRDFVSKVAECRGLTVEQVEEVAQGRVWTGASALKRGLVDELGGLDLAVERARERAGLSPDGPEPEYVRGYTPPLRRIVRADPLGWSGAGLREPALLCPVRVALR